MGVWASHPHRLHNRVWTEKLDNPFHATGKHVQAHLSAHPLACQRHARRSVIGYASCLDKIKPDLRRFSILRPPSVLPDF